MILKDLLDELLRRLMVAVVWNLLERLVGGCKDGVVGGSAIQSLDQIWVLVNELCKLGGILAAGDELVDCQVWLAVVAVVAVTRWVLGVVRLFVWVVLNVEVDILDIGGGRIEPAVDVPFHHGVWTLKYRLCFLARGIDRRVKGIGRVGNGLVKGLMDRG